MEREKQIEKYCEDQGFPMGSCSSMEQCSKTKEETK